MKLISTYFDKNFSTNWDKIINWNLRQLKTIKKLNSILKAFNCKSVLDVAAGTGFDSICLVKKKFSVVSQDKSSEMLKKLKINASKHNVHLETICAPWGKYNYKKKKFDAVICLGNSFVCELSKKKRKIAINEWYRLLKKKGIIIIDHRNYENIKKKNQINLKSYNYNGAAKIICKKINKHYSLFNYKFNDGNELNLKMYPILKKELINTFEESGFSYLYSLYDYELKKKNYKFYQHVFIK